MPIQVVYNAPRCKRIVIDFESIGNNDATSTIFFFAHKNILLFKQHFFFPHTILFYKPNKSKLLVRILYYSLDVYEYEIRFTACTEILGERYETKESQIHIDIRRSIFFMYVGPFYVYLYLFSLK